MRRVAVHGIIHERLMLRDFTMPAERKSVSDDNVVVRMPPALRDAIERQAEREHRTVSGQVRFLLACAIESQMKQQGHAR